jgi:4-oxalmesaconate hydratase
MIIDCHGHYTTAPEPLNAWRKQQTESLKTPSLAPSKGSITVSDDQIRDSLENAQLKLQRSRGTDLTIFSPRASAMGHHVGNETTSRHWTEHCNEMIHRVCQLYRENFVGVCQLPQSPGVDPRGVIPELERCVLEFGFVGCNLNPDPSGGKFSEPPLTDKWWYPVYEKLCELDVPAMVHVSQACNPAFHTTGSYYLSADTVAFMQLMMSDLFKDFPTLRFIIPHGGGAVPFHWGRFRGIAQDQKRPPLPELMRDNVFFDTCVYHQPGIDLLLKVVPVDNILFASEMVGAVRGIDPETGHYYDDTRRYIDGSSLSAADKQKVFEGNIRRVFPRLGSGSISRPRNGA